MVERFAAYFKLNPTWGSLHIVLDDLNTENHHVEFCIKSAQERGDKEGEDLGRILLKLSESQRARIDRLVTGSPQDL